MEKVGANFLPVKVTEHTIFYNHYLTDVMTYFSNPQAGRLTPADLSCTIAPSTFMWLKLKSQKGEKN